MQSLPREQREEAQRLQQQYPEFWTEDTEDEVQQMPGDDEIDRMKDIQKQARGYDTERQTPAFRQRQSEIMKQRRSDEGDDTDQGGDTDQSSTERDYRQGSQESEGREQQGSQESEDEDQQGFRESENEDQQASQESEDEDEDQRGFQESEDEDGEQQASRESEDEEQQGDSDE